MPPKKTIDDYIHLAAERGFQLLGGIPIATTIPTRWSCDKCDYEWDTTYNSIANGDTGCPRCAGCERKTKQEYDYAASERRFTFVGIVPKNTRTKTDWCCGAGHIWSASFDHIFNHRRGCPKCYGNAPVTENQYAEAARARGWTYLGPFPRNAHVPVSWKCGNRHEFKARYHDITSQNTGCPDCARLSNKSEEICRELMCEIFDDIFPSCRPEFLRRPETMKCLELDGFAPRLKLAFEYQGRQHIEYSDFFHRGDPEKFEDQQARDDQKRKMCEAADVFLVTIAWPLNHNTPEEIRATILEQTKTWVDPRIEKETGV
jgi:hypothetical protein